MGFRLIFECFAPFGLYCFKHPNASVEVQCEVAVPGGAQTDRQTDGGAGRAVQEGDLGAGPR